tara:strand:+ start:1091 stop:1420 length:330 start_codon:yes stop_codon:yes gene_type:complete
MKHRTNRSNEIARIGHRAYIMAKRDVVTGSIIQATNAEGVIDRSQLFEASPRTGVRYVSNALKQLREQQEVLTRKVNVKEQRKIEKRNSGLAFIHYFLDRAQRVHLRPF